MARRRPKTLDSAAFLAALLSLASLPLAGAHESCCEAARRARAARRLDAVVLSKSAEACPWLLLGLLTTAALAAAKLPVGSIRSLLTSDDKCSSKDRGGGARLVETVRLTLFAAFLGLITPLCSCGALPLAAGLIAAGSDLRAVVAFLTAAQSAGLDSAAVTVGLLGWRVAVFRLAGSVVLAVASGVAVGMGGRRRHHEGKDDGGNKEAPSSPPPCCGGSSEGISEEKKNDEPCCAADAAPPSTPASEKPAAKTQASDEKEDDESSSFWLWTFLRSLLRTFDEIWPVLLFGVLVTACVEKLWTGESLPLRPPQPPRPPPPGWDDEEDGPWDDGSSEGSPLLASLGLPPWVVDLLVRTSVVAAALPLQLCEHGVVSFAAALEKAGATPGTAHAFLLSAPATNAASLGVLLRARGGGGGGGGPGAAFRGAAGIAAAAVALSYIADRPDVLGAGGAGSAIGDAVETFALPGWFADGSVYACGALLAASVAGRAARFLRSCGGGGDATAGKTAAAAHAKTE